MPTTNHDAFTVSGRRVLVTGASRGLGYMIAEGLLAAGAEVMITGRDPHRLDEARTELGKLGHCKGIVADVTTSEGIAAIGQAVATFAPGGLHALVNNAGVTWGAPIEAFPRKGWDKVLSTNLVAVFELTVALLPHLTTAATPTNPARVVTIGSVDGMRVPEFDNFSYSASKAGVHMLTRHLAVRLAGQNVTVNTIAPGAFPSDMTEFALSDPAARSRIERDIPLGRIGEADDLAAAVIYLCSPAGRYVTGATLAVDGGITARS